MAGRLAIRPYRPSDLDALYEICLRTGSAGRDATDVVEDRKLFGELYAAPYAVLEPEHAFVLGDDDSAAVGYVLGALDTIAFEDRCEVEWWPALRARHPEQSGGSRLDDLLVHLIHHRSVPDAVIVATYPSHLHIDLLPSAQGAGWGRRLLAELFESLRAAGSRGVHWGVSVQNRRAVGFYRHLGSVELTSPGATHTFGIRL